MNAPQHLDDIFTSFSFPVLPLFHLHSYLKLNPPLQLQHKHSLKTVYVHSDPSRIHYCTFHVNVCWFKEFVGLKNNSTRCTCTCPFIETIAESLCAVINVSEGSYIEWRQQDFSTLTNTSGDLLFKMLPSSVSSGTFAFKNNDNNN